MTEKDLITIIQEDKWMMNILRLVEELRLQDWWIGAGFVRSKVWDYLHGYKIRTPLPDIDVIYFDKSDYAKNEERKFSTKKEDAFQSELTELFPSVKWSVTNQARMHLMHERPAYKNSEEALSEWSETATCVGVSIVNNKVILIAPHGVQDLVNLIIRPVPGYAEKYNHDPKIFENRIKDKKWLEKWPKLTVKLNE